jgi:flagellum-specific peptidoglycan hydrolase FlgJ
MAAMPALMVKAHWGTPASVLIAQAALETGWGAHVKGNAYFGIKAEKNYLGQNIKFSTHEVVSGKSEIQYDNFRAYDNFLEAAEAYGRFLFTTPLFSGAFQFKDDPYEFITFIAPHYATDPRYENKVASMIRANHLARLDGFDESKGKS